MIYRVEYHQKVYDDIKRLKFTKKQLIKLKEKIEIIALNPYPKAIGGLGEPLAGSLRGLLKFRFMEDYRIVYKLLVKDNIMKILIIGLRKDMLVYKGAKKRI